MSNVVQTLIEMISSKYGLTPKPNWPKRIHQHIGALCEKCDISISTATSKVLCDPMILREIAGGLTIEESYFFRHHHHFDTLIAFLEKRLRGPNPEQNVSIWSAGCAFGSEPYSLVMAAKRRLGAEELRRISIFACDLNPKAIQRAKQGLFHEWSFRETDQYTKTQYFRKVESNLYELRDDIRSMVQFEHLSIQEKAMMLHPKSLDAIFFRNVAVYMDLDSISKIYNIFATLLKPDGLLLVSATDPQPRTGHFRAMTTNDTTVYQLQDQASVKGKPINGFDIIPKRALKNRSKRPKRLPKTKTDDQKRAISLPVDRRKTVSWVRELADKGNYAQAMNLCHQFLDKSKDSSAVYRLRGELFLHDRQSNKALQDFEKAVSLEPEDPIVRFWYALGLESAGKFVNALGEVKHLIKQLASLPSNELLSDGETKVSELLQAATSLERNLE